MTRIIEPIYEYACHEGNYGVSNILRGQRKMKPRRPEARGRATFAW